jgi:hypothetical protein
MPRAGSQLEVSMKTQWLSPIYLETTEPRSNGAAQGFTFGSIVQSWIGSTTRGAGDVSVVVEEEVVAAEEKAKRNQQFTADKALPKLCCKNGNSRVQE